MEHNYHVSFSGHLYIIGMGSIGQGTLPLILRHIEMPLENITIITADDRGKEEAAAYGVKFIKEPVTQSNYRELIPLKQGDFLLNVSVDVSSVALMELCREKGALYLDTCTEPWKGWYEDPTLSTGDRTNYALRQHALSLRKEGKGNEGAPTAIITNGANPGLVSYLLKEALLNLAADIGVEVKGKPQTREDWAKLAQALNVKTIHVAERDTQVSATPKAPGEFVNTWSIDGFYSEGIQPAEMGWGTHEKELPPDGRIHTHGPMSAIYLMNPGFWTHVRTWTPLAGTFIGKVITHDESISIATYLTVEKDGQAVYRPTVHYAYHPCDAAVSSLYELAGYPDLKLQEKQRLMMDEILPGGIDELGVLLMGHKKGAYWYGSQLSVDEARSLAPYNNATSLQVTSAVLAGMIFAMKNPTQGVVDANEIDHEFIMSVCRPYLGPVVGKYSDWTPLKGRLPEDKPLFPAQNIDETDPWQFKNFRITDSY